jgi:hypothetical protein
MKLRDCEETLLKIQTQLLNSLDMSEKDHDFLTLSDSMKSDIFSKAQFNLLIKRIRELKLT